jgi:spermidine synthase
MAITKNTITENLNPSFGYFYNRGETLYKGKTRFQKIELINTPEFGKVLLLDNITQVVQKNEYQYHEPMVHGAMLAHSNPERVLVIGAGDGGILREVLRHKCVKHVDFAELDQEVVEFSKKYMPEISDGAFANPKVHAHYCDGRKFVESKTREYDVVIMDMTDPVGPSKYLYTKEFFKAVKASFRNNRGLFAMHTESPVARPKTFGVIVKTLNSVFDHVTPLYTYIQMYGVMWSISVASDSPKMKTLSPLQFNKKIYARKLKNLKAVTGESLQAMRTSQPWIDELLKQKTYVLTDQKPDISGLV